MNKKIILSQVIAAALLLAQPVQAQQQSNQSNRKRVERPLVDTITSVKTVLKELTQELPAEKNAVIKIVNTTCNLDIRPWPESKVKMVTTAYVEEEKAGKITPEEMMENAGIVFKSFGNRVDIQTRASFSNDLPSVYSKAGNGNKGTSADLFNSSSGVTESLFNTNQPVRWNIVGPGTRQKMTVYVPKGCKLDIDNRNTSVIINDDIDDARFKLNHSNLDARNFRKVYITAEYSGINISDVQEAELELENVNFTGGVLQMLDLDSKASEIDYESGMSLYLRSQNDRVTVDQISKVAGRKLYGDLRIGKLITELDIEGLNADIRIRNISPLTEKIRIVDQYADLRLPVKNIANYAVLFKGEKSTVFTPFDKVVIPDPAEIKEEQKTMGKPTDTRKAQKETNPQRKNIDAILQQKDLDAVTADKKERSLLELALAHKDASDVSHLGERSPSQFKASSGDTNGKHTRFDITCNKCSVDFK